MIKFHFLPKPQIQKATVLLSFLDLFFLLGFLSFLNKLLFEEETFFGELSHLLQNLLLLSTHLPENQQSVNTTS